MHCKSPLRIQTPLQKRTLVTFHFEALPLFKINAWNIIQHRQTCLYPLLPTMKGAQEELIIHAMEELSALYRHDNVTLNQQFVWMKLLVERSSTIPVHKKEQIYRRLSMFDQLWEESKLIQREREAYLAKGIAKGIEQGIEQGIEKGSEKAHQRDLLLYVEIHFPTLLAVAKHLTAQPHSTEHFQSLLMQLFRAKTIEEAQAVLLQG